MGDGQITHSNQAAVIALRNFVTSVCIFPLIYFWFPFDVSRTMFHEQRFVSWWIRAEFMNDGWLPLKWYGDANVARPAFECVLSHERERQRQKIDEIFRSCLTQSLFILSICRAIRYKIQYKKKKELLQQK